MPFEMPFNGVIRRFTPSLGASKAILVICPNDPANTHVGTVTDTLASPGALETIVSRTDLETNGLDPTLEPGSSNEFVREEFTVFSSVNEWLAPLGLGALVGPAVGIFPFTAGVSSWASGTGIGESKVQVLTVRLMGDGWPDAGLIGEEALLTIFKFFDTFRP